MVPHALKGLSGIVEPAEKDKCMREKGEPCPVFPLRYTCFACMDTHSDIIEPVEGVTVSLPSLSGGWQDTCAPLHFISFFVPRKCF